MKHIWIALFGILLMSGVAHAADSDRGTAPRPGDGGGAQTPGDGSPAPGNGGSTAPSSGNGGTTAPNGGSTAPTAGKMPIGVSAAEMDAVIAGWSAKRDLLGKDVYNEQNQKIGKVSDMIVSPDKSVSFAIVGTGGFVGMGKHDVAIPTDQIKLEGNKFVLAGASKDALKQLPGFEYSRKQGSQ